MGFVLEPQKRVPVVYDVDVVVAGGGVSGVFAALAAAREGADTVLIERFGAVGGNIGPGMIVGGSIRGPGKIGDTVSWLYGGVAGIAREFVERYTKLGQGTRGNDLRESSIASYLAFKMLDEAGVKLLLSTYVTDPIREGNRVRGVFVENKSGRQAVRAKVVIDATGEADVARRAGAPAIHPKLSYAAFDSHAPTGMQIYAVAGGVDWQRYEGRPGKQRPGKLVKRVDDLAEIRVGNFARLSDLNDGLAAVSAKVLRPENNPTIDPKVDAGNGLHISRLEAEFRKAIFEHLQAYQEAVPGFDNAYLITIAPYLGSRGGPCIEGDYTLTIEDCRAGRRFDDVIYITAGPEAFSDIWKKKGGLKWTDVPYRVMLPKGVQGLMAVGRSASGIPDTLLRNRQAVMHMGQAAGTAAALAIKNGVSPREVNVKHLQIKLLEAGFHLGNEDRLKELGLKN